MICRCRFNCLHGMVNLPYVGQQRLPLWMCMRHILQKLGPAVAVWCHQMWCLQYPQDSMLRCSRDQGWRQSITLGFQLALVIQILEGTLVVSW